MEINFVKIFLIALWVLFVSHLSFDKDFSSTMKTTAITILSVIAVLYLIFGLF